MLIRSPLSPSDDAPLQKEAARGVSALYSDHVVHASFLERAKALRSERRFAASARCLEQALALQPCDGEVLYALGKTRELLGDLPRAKAAYERCLAVTSGHLHARNNLARVLVELGQREEALTLLEQTLRMSPRFVPAHANLGALLAEARLWPEALAAYARALVLDAECLAARMGQALVLSRLERVEDAVAIYQQIKAKMPASAAAPEALTRLWLEHGDARAAQAEAEAYLTEHPGHSGLIALLTLSLAALGQEARVQALFDTRQVRVFDGELAEADVEPFHRALAAHVRAHPSLSYAPRSHATEQGFHTGELLLEDDGPMVRMVQIIERALHAYLRDVPQDAQDPFLAPRPSQVALHTWAVLLEGQGFQRPHVHPAAWLSGVYYVQIPASIVAEDPAARGYLALGGHDLERAFNHAPEGPTIMPAPGRLVLFPASYYHRTVPHQGAETRISIAFDVEPSPHQERQSAVT